MIRKDMDFDKEIRYKLFRTVKDIINPSISKKNISSYKIVFNEELLPVRVFYPKKVTSIKKVIIYVPGDCNITKCRSKYTDICTELAVELDELIIAVDYFDIKNTYPNSLNKVEEVVKYLYEELKNNGISNENIILMGDSTGGNFISSITFRFIQEHINYISKEILLYPMLSGDYYKDSKYPSINKALDTNKSFINGIRKYMNDYTIDKKNLLLRDVCPLLNDNYKDYPSTLIITGELDPLKDEGEEFYKKLSNDSKYLNIDCATHGFISTKDFSIKKEYLKGIKEFI